jgi:hypothetical protein
VIAPGEAFSVTVGAAGGIWGVDCADGELVAECFWQPAKIKIPAIATGNAIRLALSLLIISSKDFENEFRWTRTSNQTLFAS